MHGVAQDGCDDDRISWAGLRRGMVAAGMTRTSAAACHQRAAAEAAMLQPTAAVAGAAASQSAEHRPMRLLMQATGYQTPASQCTSGCCAHCVTIWAGRCAVSYQ